MTDIQVFNNTEFGELRIIDQNGEPWFVGKDVAEALGYGEGKSLANAVANHVDEDDRSVTEMMTEAGKRNFVIINESGLYSLVLSSKLPTAKKFKRWVTSEVLPSIRKNGGYISGQETLSPEELSHSGRRSGYSVTLVYDDTIPDITVLTQIEIAHGLHRCECDCFTNLNSALGDCSSQGRTHVLFRSALTL